MTRLLLLIPLILAGCAHEAATTDQNNPNQSTQVQARTAGDSARRADDTLAQMQPIIQKLAPENLADSKPRLDTLVAQARDDLKQTVLAATGAEKQATADEAARAALARQNQQLKDDAAQHSKLKSLCEWTAYVLWAIGVGLVLYAIFGNPLNKGHAIAAAAICGFGGGMFAAIAAWLQTIQLIFICIIGAVVVVGLGIGAVLIWKVWHQGSMSQKIVTSIDVAKQAGAVTFNAAAAPILDAIQGPKVKQLVDQIQAVT